MASAIGSVKASSPSSPDSGRLVVISGPSGVGKSTVIDALAQRVPFHFAVSATTRSRRPREVDGVHYHFVEEPTFHRMIAEEDLLEWAEYGGSLYGTPRSEVYQHLDQGHDVLLDIEVHGSRQVKARHPDAIMIFIAPPGIEELERRLRGRGDTDPEAVMRRLGVARHQIGEAQEIFDYLVINDDVDRAADEIAAILRDP